MLLRPLGIVLKGKRQKTSIDDNLNFCIDKVYEVRCIAELRVDSVIG